MAAVVRVLRTMLAPYIMDPARRPVSVKLDKAGKDWLRRAPRVAVNEEKIKQQSVTGCFDGASVPSSVVA